MRKILCCLFLTLTTTPCYANPSKPPQNDFEVMGARVCKEFRDGKTYAEVVMIVRDLTIAKYELASPGARIGRSRIESATNFASTMTNGAVILYCPEYKPLTNP